MLCFARVRRSLANLCLRPSVCRFVIHSTLGLLPRHMYCVMQSVCVQGKHTKAECSIMLHMVHVLFACFSDVCTEDFCVPGACVRTIAVTDTFELAAHPGGEHSSNQQACQLCLHSHSHTTCRGVGVSSSIPDCSAALTFPSP